MYSRPCYQNNDPRLEPIVMPVQERVCNRYHTVEQPVICPINTRIVHHYVPRPVYYPSYTQTEEVQTCTGATPEIKKAGRPAFFIRLNFEKNLSIVLHYFLIRK